MTDFKPMLAAKANPAKLKFPLILQAKLDGIRCSIVDGKALTRTLKEVPNREIFEALSKPEYEGLDGELIVGSPIADDAYRTTVSYVMSHDKTGAEWHFHVFDVWNQGDAPYDCRYRILHDRIAYDNIFNAHRGRLKSVDHTIVRDADELETVEGQCVAYGHEGVILRSPTAPYKFGRGSATAGDLLKLKRFIDFEAKITGCFEMLHNGNEATTNALGRTERSSHKENKTGLGVLGGFHCVAINGPAKGQTFKVGTGFTAEQRQQYWYDQAGYIGATIKVKSFPIGVKDAPRHPVFLGFRDMEVDG